MTGQVAIRGWSLLELIVSIVLLSSSLIVIAGLIPASVSGLRKADDLQAATLYGVEVIEEACRGRAKPDVSDITVMARINNTDFMVRRQILNVDNPAYPARPTLYDVAVTLKWPTVPRPVKLRTRIYRP